MAIVEINLEKPALVEEHRSSTETTPHTESAGSSRKSSSSGGSKGKLVVVLAAVAAVGLLVRKLRNRGGDSGTPDEPRASETEYEHGPEPEIGGDESGGRKRRFAGAIGLVVALVGLVAVVRRRGE